MKEIPQLHSSIVAMVSLASGIASNHPDMGQCQLARLRQAGVPQQQLDTVIEVARYIRDEAGQKLDLAFDEVAGSVTNPKAEKGQSLDKQETASACCTSTASGQTCC